MGECSNIEQVKLAVHNNLKNIVKFEPRSHPSSPYEVNRYFGKLFIKNWGNHHEAKVSFVRYKSRNALFALASSSEGIPFSSSQKCTIFTCDVSSLFWTYKIIWKRTLIFNHRQRDTSQNSNTQHKGQQHLTSSVFTRMHTGCLFRLFINVINFLSKDLVAFQLCSTGFWS